MSIKGCKGKKVTETTQISNIYAETNCTKKKIRDGIKYKENAVSTHIWPVQQKDAYNSKLKYGQMEKQNYWSIQDFH